jgi:hypothetical protein
MTSRKQVGWSQRMVPNSFLSRRPEICFARVFARSDTIQLDLFFTRVFTRCPFAVTLYSFALFPNPLTYLCCVSYSHILYPLLFLEQRSLGRCWACFRFGLSPSHRSTPRAACPLHTTYDSRRLSAHLPLSIVSRSLGALDPKYQ